MKIRLSNIKYSYFKSGLISISCAIEIYDETSDTVIWSRSCSSNFNINNLSSLNNAMEKVKQEAINMWNAYQLIAKKSKNMLGSLNFAEALKKAISDLEDDINVTIGA